MNFVQAFRQLLCRQCYVKTEALKTRLKRYEPEFRYYNTIRVSGDSVRQRLQASFPDAKIYMADSVYDIIEWKELLEWLNNDSTADMEYCVDVFDCDDFAFESAARMHLLGKEQGKNFSYRWAWGNTPMGYHAFCIADIRKDGERKMYIIEPQNRDTKLWKLSDYKPDFIVF